MDSNQDNRNWPLLCFNKYFEDNQLSQKEWANNDKMEFAKPEEIFAVPLAVGSSAPAPSRPYLGDVICPDASEPTTSTNEFLASLYGVSNTSGTDMIPMYESFISPMVYDFDPVLWDLGDMAYQLEGEAEQAVLSTSVGGVSSAPEILQSSGRKQRRANSPQPAANVPSRITKSRSPPQPSSPSSRYKHNEIEKRYRISLNQRFAALGDAIPDRLLQEEMAGHIKKKVGKAEFLVCALKYIKELEATEIRLQAEKMGLIGSVRAWESAWRKESGKGKGK